MNIVCVGGGPAGLYLAILMKKEDPSHRITVLERNKPRDTFGFGVVFSDQTLAYLRDADAESYAEITQKFAHWDDIAIHYQQQLVTSTGHGFSGLSRQALLDILQRRCQALGVELVFERECSGADLEAYAKADLVLGTDGVNSSVRTHYQAEFGPQIDLRPNRFVWLGTTFPFAAFTFYFKENQHGLWRVHAYRYAPDAPAGEPQSTFIVECTEDTFQRSGLDPEDEAATLAYCEQLFKRRAAGPSAAQQPQPVASLPDRAHAGAGHYRNIGTSGRCRAYRALLDRVGDQAGAGGRHRAAMPPSAGRPTFPRRSRPTKRTAGRRSRACSAPPRRAWSGSKTPSVITAS